MTVRLCYIDDTQPATHVATLAGIGRAGLCARHAAMAADLGRPTTPIEAVDGLDTVSIVAYGSPHGAEGWCEC